MGMFDSFSDLSGNRKLPSGKTPADVAKVVQDEGKGTVTIRFRFRAYDVILSQTHYLKRKTGEPNELGAKILAKQLRNAGFTVKSGADMQAALEGLNGMPVEVDVVNRKNSDYQDFFILGVGVRERGAEDAQDNTGATDGADDLPF